MLQLTWSLLGHFFLSCQNAMQRESRLRDSSRASAASSATSSAAPIGSNLGLLGKPMLSSLPKRNPRGGHRSCLYFSTPFPPFYLALHIKLTSNTITNTFYSAHNDVGEAVRFSKPMSKRASTVGQVRMRVSERTQSTTVSNMCYRGHSFQHGSNMLKGMPPLLSSEVIDKLS